jgi:ABC-type nitrate/sulfonate/bicarbonate transport system substrate-binding protein
MRTMRPLRRLAMLCTAVALVAAACGGDDSSSDTAATTAAPAELTTVKLQLDWTPNTNHTGFYVADKLGYYAEVGIDIEILPYSNANADTVVASGQADFGISFQDAMTYSAASGLPITSVMAILQRTSEEVAIRADRTDIASPKDLDGKIYAGFGLPSEAPRLQAMIKADGGKGEFTNATLNTAAYEALYNGSADFTIPFMTWEGVEFGLTGEEIKTFKFQDYGLPQWYGVVLTVNNDYLAKNEDLARRFVQASAKGFQYAVDNPTEAGQILIDSNPGAFTNPELVMASAKLLAEEYYLDANGVFGTQTAGQWADYAAFLFEQGLLVDKDGKPLTVAPDTTKMFTTALLAG